MDSDDTKWKMLGRYKINKNGLILGIDGSVLSPFLCKSSGYYRIELRYPNDTPKKHSIHRLVAESFLENRKNDEVVDHINGIKTDNRSKNLRWCSARENCKFYWEKNKEQVGVSFDKAKNKFVSNIFINGKLFYIGNFELEKDAIIAYKDILENGTSYKYKNKRDKRSVKGSISFDSSRNKWVVGYRYNGKTIYVGRFETKQKAEEVLLLIDNNGLGEINNFRKKEIDFG